MGTLGRATKIEFADGTLIEETSVEVELCRAGVLKVFHSYDDEGVEHQMVSYYAAGEWKSFDLETYTLVIENHDDKSTTSYPGLSTSRAGHVAVKHLTNIVKLDKSSALACTNDLLECLKVDVNYSGFPRLSMKFVPTSDQLPVHDTKADVAA